MTVIEATQLTITEIEPGDQAANIRLTVKIEAVFSHALDPDTLNEATFIVARNSSTPIAGEVTYRTRRDGRFVAVFTPAVTLQPETTYQVTLVGYSNPFSGATNQVIRNAVGVPFGENFSWVFSTGTVDPQPPVIKTPLRSSSVSEDRPTFEWEEVSGASEYEIQIAKTELMTPLYLPEESSFQYPLTFPTGTTQWVPDVAFDRGQGYFWRMRSKVGQQWSAWTAIKYSFYVLREGEPAPYIPEPEFSPEADQFRLITGNEPFQVIGIDPFPGKTQVMPEEIRVTFNKAIDPDSVTFDTVAIQGTKLIQSDPRVRNPGVVTPLDIGIDQENPNVLVIVTSGQGTQYRRTSPVSDSIRIFENMFKDIIEASMYRYGFGKHFHDLTEIADGQDDLYHDLQISELRLAQAAPFPTATLLHTDYRIESPVDVQEAELRFVAAADAGSQLNIYASNDGGANFVAVPFILDTETEITEQRFSFASPGNSLVIRIQMSTSDQAVTPVISWFMLLFNEV